MHRPSFLRSASEPGPELDAWEQLGHGEPQEGACLYTWHKNDCPQPSSSASFHNGSPHPPYPPLPLYSKSADSADTRMGGARCGFAASGALRALQRHLHWRVYTVGRRGAALARACLRRRGGAARGLVPGGVPAALLLHGVTVLWGSQHAVIKLAVEAGASACGLNAARFAAASALLAPFLVSATGAEVAAGLELGAWSFLGFALQTAGLGSTTAARSGFLLYLNVKLVPLLGLALGRRPPRSAWLAAAIAAVGTVVLAGDGAPWAVGDSLSVAAAAASAMFILRLEARARDARPPQLAATTVAATAVLAAACAAATGVAAPARWVPGGTLAAALYLGAVPTALATVVQARAQKAVSAERAAVIYAMDPVYGALFAYWLLGESFGVRGFVGAALIFVAAIVSNYAVGDSEKSQEATKLCAERQEERSVVAVGDGIVSTAEGNGSVKGDGSVKDRDVNVATQGNGRVDVAPLGAAAVRAKETTIEGQD